MYYPGAGSRGRSDRRVEFETVDKFEKHLADGGSLRHVVFQDIDLRAHTENLLGADLEGAVFLGCTLEPEAAYYAREQGALRFPIIPDVPYRLYRGSLYTVPGLMAGYRVGDAASYEATPDGRIYRHFLDTGGARPQSIIETLARRLHDHAISDALEEAIAHRPVVAVMGGHGMRRDSASYAMVAEIAARLTRAGFLMASGGGPGAMEATNLGAWMANRPLVDLERAIAALEPAPTYETRGMWLDTAFSVRESFPGDDRRPVGPSIGIPTWHYGHEPPNLFSTQIAKYFANSVREAGLVSIAMAGIIFAPGSAGTLQEVFQDAAQNHYLTMGTASPMIFLGTDFWSRDLPAYPLLKSLADNKPYSDLIVTTDEADEIVRFITSFNARRPA